MSLQEKPHQKMQKEIVEEKKKLDGPKDRFHMVYFLFFLLGLFHFLPMSFFQTATSYFMYKFRNVSSNDTSSDHRTSLQAFFHVYLAMTLQITEVIFLILTIFLEGCVRIRIRLVAVVSSVLAFFVILTVFTKIDTDSWQLGFFGMVMAINCAINAMNAIFTVTIYSVLAAFPQKFLEPYMTGGGLARIVTSLFQILSLTFELSVTDSGLIYFLMGVFVIGGTLATLLITDKTNKFFTHYMNNLPKKRKQMASVTRAEAFELLKKIWPTVVTIGSIVLGGNASPSALVVSEGEGNGPWNDKYFIPTITYLLGALCDVIGRHFAFKLRLNLSPIQWVLVAITRVAVFIPLIMFCNAQPRHHLPVWFPHDYQYVIIVIVYNLTGGYLLSQCTANVSKLVTPEELSRAYHVNMFFSALQMAIFSFSGMVTTSLL